MLFQHKHLLEEMRKTGRPGTAEILSVKTVGSAGNIRAVWAPDEDLTTTWMDCRMKLRVQPQDRTEAQFEATVLTRVHTLKFQGGKVPVWYDPSDHSKVVVDYEADVQEKMQLSAQLAQDLQDGDRMVHRYDQQLALAWTPVGGVLLPIEARWNRGQGRVTATGRLGSVLTEPARAAGAYVQGNAVRLVPGTTGDWFAAHDIQIDVAPGSVPSATPEDGASAGLAVAAALVSMLSGRIVRPETTAIGGLASTGELIAVSGFKDKVAAAARGHAMRIVAPAGNEQGSQQMAERQRAGLEFVFVATADEAIRATLAKHPMKGFTPPG